MYPQSMHLKLPASKRVYCGCVLQVILPIRPHIFLVNFSLIGNQYLCSTIKCIYNAPLNYIQVLEEVH